MRKTKHCGFLLLAILLSSHIALADEATSESDPRLERWLKQYPDADANNDGVLTESEARDYRNAQRERRQDSTQNARPAPTHADVAYGPHQRNVLDVYLADSDQPTPLLIYIHGGGFVGGNKRNLSPTVLNGCLESGISVAAIHYRFVSEVPFPAPQQDAAHAVQFLRHKSVEWNFDSNRLAAYGGSAGAGLSLWLGFHDDLADPDSDDPVRRESTRLIAVGSRGGQTTYDPNVIKEWIGGRAHEHPSLFLCYDIDSIDEITRPDLKPLFDEVSAINHLSPDDPPVWMLYGEPYGPLPADARPGQGIHHPTFGLKLKEQMDALEIESVYLHTDDFDGDHDRHMLEFFQRQLNSK